MKTREQIVADMCMTWRHDFGLTRGEPGSDDFAQSIMSGMTRDERQELYNHMNQVFEHCFKDLYQELAALKNGRSVLVPTSKPQAMEMLKVATYFLDNSEDHRA
jgi:hypothetical protein